MQRKVMSTYDPKHHHRRSIRLPGYDYTRPGASVWQRNYYERIIHIGGANGRASLHATRRYIAENPRRWHLDRSNPNSTGPDPTNKSR